MKPDPYEHEPAVEVDPVTFAAYMEAASNVLAWQKEADRLKRMLAEQMGDAHAGLVDGRKLITNRPGDRWAEARMIKDYPELTSHYIKPVYQDKFDFSMFQAAHPDIVEKYRVRSFRSLADV
jgi:hypothetical protein